MFKYGYFIFYTRVKAYWYVVSCLIIFCICGFVREYLFIFDLVLIIWKIYYGSPTVWLKS